MRFSLQSACGMLLYMVVVAASPNRPSTIAVRPASGTYGGSTSLQARLTFANRPLPSKNISFSMNGINVGNALTNSEGVATLGNVSLVAIRAGTYASGITAAFAGDATFKDSQDTAGLRVKKAAASVTPNAASKTYGASNPALTGTLSGFLAGDNVTAAYSRKAGETVSGGPYTIAATLSPRNVLSNYSILYNTAIFTIDPAPLVVTAQDATKLMETPNPSFPASYAGFVNGDTVSSLAGVLSFSTDATIASPAGTYTVTPGGLTSSNYALSFRSGTLTVVDPYITDKNIHLPPDYLSFQPPAAGGSYADTPFYTRIKRLSDSMHTADAAGGSPFVVTITPEYSTMSPFNEDNTRLLLVYRSYFAVYDGSGNFLKNLPFEINASSQPRWSRSDPNLLYYVRGNQLKQYDTASNTTSVVHTFAGYSVISGKGKSDICFDGNHFVLVGDDRYIFVYEISTDSTGNVFDTGGIAYNNVFITPNDNVMISWTATGTGRYQGIELFDRTMTFLRQVARTDGHSDLMRDTNGDEVLIWANGNDPKPICNNGIVKIRLADATQTCLVTFDWSLAVHVSAPDEGGWVFVETYAPGDPIPPSGWFAYTSELMQVRLDGTQVRRFAHHRSRPFNGYTYQPKLSISRDGTKLTYASNFGMQQISGYPAEYSDAYFIDFSDGSSSGKGGGF